MTAAYQEPGSGSQQPEVEDAREAVVREGARRLLAAVVEEAGSTFLGRR